MKKIISSCVLISGWFAGSDSFINLSKERDSNYAYMSANTAKLNKNLKLFWISQGGVSDIAYKNCHVMMQKLKDMGVNFKYYESKDGGHTWPVWREDLLLFAPQLFK